MKSTLKNMILSLFVITAVCSLAVGAVYMVTKEPINEAKRANTNSSLLKVLPEFDNDPSSEVEAVEADGGEVLVYTARKADQVVGYAVQSFTKNGFGGEIKVMVGFKPDGEIVRIETLQHAETPGLGDKIETEKSGFALQFSGKNPENMKMSVRKDGGDVDAITASTITSRAFIDAIDRAHKVLVGFVGENKKGVENE